MLTLQHMVDIASRFDTLIAHALIRACVVKALETGEPLTLPDRARRMADPPPMLAACEPSHKEWERMVSRNRPVAPYL